MLARFPVYSACVPFAGPSTPQQSIERAADVLAEHLPHALADPFMLVPLPAYDTDSVDKLLHTGANRLACAIARRTGADVRNPLIFYRPQHRDQDPQVLLRELNVIDYCRTPVVLVDDSVRTGARMRAAESRLRSFGMLVTAGVVAAWLGGGEQATRRGVGRHSVEYLNN